MPSDRSWESVPNLRSSGDARVAALREADPRWALPAIAVVYFAVAKLGLSYADEGSIVSAVWPPSGVAVAVVVLFGARVWPAIWIGAIVANATGDGALAVAAAIATGNAVAAIAAGALLERAGFDPGLRRVRDVLALAILAGSFATAINATIGVAALWLGDVIDAAGLFDAWRTWWLGDMTGVVLVAPAVLIGARGFTGLPHRDRFAEASLLALALVLGTLFVLRDSITLAAPVFPVIILSALRFRQAGAVFSSLAAATLIVAYTAAGNGPFAGSEPETDLLRAQLFVVLAALTGLLIASMRSEWERAEAALATVEESERALAEAQALAHVGSWEWDIVSDRSTWSDEMYRIAGVEPGKEALGYEAYLGAVHPDDRRTVANVVAEALESGEMAPFRHRVIRPDGSIRTADCRGRVLTDGDGRAIKLSGTMQDVSEQQLAQDRFRALLETAPDAMVIVDELGRIAFANSQTERLFGYSVEELTGKPVEALVPARARAGHPAHRDAFLSDPRARPMGTGLDLTALRKDGSEFPVEISLSPLQTAEGTLISSAIRDVTERKLAEQALEHQALHDPLTGLPNRVLFVDRLEHALTRSKRTGSRLAVFFLDIDEFKNVNDSLGHEAGDLVLAALPPRLRLALRQADTVARFGGDEFVILCEDLEAESDVTKIAGRLIEAFEQSIELEGREYHLSVSVGVVIVESGAGGAAAILRDADVAMYRAKGLGRGRFELFDARMRARVLERIQLESDLRRATGGGELELHYQPVLSLGGGDFVGAEALVRWRRPGHALQAPDAFIECAEETGLIVPIGAWVIEEACRSAAAWQRPGSPPLRISINLSPRQVTDSNVADLLSRTLERTGLDPRLVSLEITESVLLSSAADSMPQLQALRNLGTRLVLDDFGTGYSSLSRLKSFPIDALKLDREFIGGLGGDGTDTAIVSALLTMARALELDVIAEGVETSEQLSWLQDHGCGFAQGYLLSHPLPATALAKVPPWAPGLAVRRTRASR